MRNFMLKYFLIVGLSLCLNAAGTFDEYEHRAYSIGGDIESSKNTFNLSKKDYTFVSYSAKAMAQDKVSTSGEFFVLIGEINNQKVNQLKLSSDYKESYVVVKVFNSKDIFDETTLVATSSEIFIKDDYTFYNIQF